MNVRSISILACLVSSSVAIADDNTTTVAAAEAAPVAAPPSAAASIAPAPAPREGLRFRNGFSLSIGQEFGSGPSEGLSGQLYGVDWRIGARINDLLSVYAQTHLSLGTASIGTASGYTGNFALAAIGEVALPQRAFVGGGFGYGVLNNPNGPIVQLRAGWHPFEQDMNATKRRLNVALDARWYFPGEQIGTVTQLALTIGYDRF